MNVGAKQNHPAVGHVFLHCSPECTLSLLAQSVSLVDDEDFEVFGPLGVHAGISGYFLDDVHHNVPILVFVVGGSHLHVVVTAEDAEFDGCRSALWLENPFLFPQLEYMLAEHLAEEGVGSGLLASPLRTVHDDMLSGALHTGKSRLSASWVRTWVI